MTLTDYTSLIDWRWRLAFEQMNPSVHFGKHVLHLFFKPIMQLQDKKLRYWTSFDLLLVSLHNSTPSSNHSRYMQSHLAIVKKNTLSQNWVGVFSWTGHPHRGGSQRPEFGSPTNPTFTVECVVVWCFWYFLCISSVWIFNDPHFGARGVVHPPCAVAILLSVSTHELFIREIIQIYQIYSNILPVSSYLGNGPISSPHIACPYQRVKEPALLFECSLWYPW